MFKILNKYKNRYSDKIIIFSIIFIALILVFIWFKDGNIMGHGESGLPFYNLSLQLKNFGYSWADYSLGHPTHIFTTSIPTYFALSILEKLGVPNYIIQALFFYIILVVSGISTFLLTKELFPNIKNRFLFISPFFYWFNPISMVIIWNRFLNNWMVYFALLPVVTFLFIRGLNRRSYIYSVAITLTIFLFSYSLASPVSSILIWSVFLYIFIAQVLEHKNSNKIFIIKYFFLTLLLYLLINFWWISQIFNYVESTDFSSSINLGFSEIGNLNTLTTLSRGGGQLIDLIRLYYRDFFENGFYWAQNYNIFISKIILFLIPTVIFWVIWKFNSNRKVLLLGAAYILVLFLMKGNNPPFGDIFEYIFIKIPYLQLFRNPFEKIGYLLPLVVSPLLVFGIQEIDNKLQRSIFRRLLYLFILFTVFIFFGYPFFSGLVFTSDNGFEKGNLKSFQIKVPSYYDKANNWLKDKGNDFRFLSLPIGGEGMTYNWKYPYSGLELSSSLYYVPSVSINTSIPLYTEFVAEIEKNQLDQNIRNYLPFISGRYVLLKKDIDFKIRKLANPDNQKVLLEKLLKNGDLIDKKEFGDLEIYETNKKYDWPMIYITPNILYLDNADVNKIGEFVSDFPENKLTFTKQNIFEENNITPNNIIISPKNIIYEEKPNNYESLTDNELLARLFYTPHLPTESIYPLIRIKEWIESPSKADFNSWVLYKTGLLGKRAVEIYKLRKENNNSAEINLAEERYIKEFNQVSDRIKVMITGAPEEQFYYQVILLNRVNSKIADIIVNYLKVNKIIPFYDVPKEDKKFQITYQFEVDMPLDYDMIFSKELGSSGLWLDGKLLNNNRVSLKKGLHEVTINFDKPEIFTPVLFKNNLNLDDNNVYSTDFDLSTVPSKYKIVFNYKFSVGNRFNIKVIQDNQLVENPLYSKDIGELKEFHGWVGWDTMIETTPGATKAEVNISSANLISCKKYLFKGTICNKYKEEFNVELTNFEIQRFNIPEVSLVVNNNELTNTTSKVRWNKISSSEYQVYIDKNNNDPEMIILSQLFNTNWKMYSAEGQIIDERKHIPVNIFANGWIINKVGSYSFTIKYYPQVLLNIGLKFATMISLLLLIVIVKALFIKNGEKQ